jgi:hypothetical protein
MATTNPLLDVEQRIIDVETKIAEYRFSRRVAKSVAFAAPPLIGGGIAAGNIFGDFSKPGSGQVAMNVSLGGLLAILFIGSILSLNDYRGQLRKHEASFRKLLAEKASLQYSSDANNSIPDAFRNYLETVPRLRDDYRSGAQRYRNRHNRFQITVIVGSILTSVASTASAQGAWSWIAVALSAAVSVSAGVISYFKFRERSMNLQQTADSIELEIQAFTLRINHYSASRLPPEEAAQRFAETIEQIKDEQRKKELQLEQPPEAQQGNTASRSGTA